MASVALVRRQRFGVARNILSWLLLLIITEYLKPRPAPGRDPEWERAINAMGARMSRFYSERQ